MSNFNNNRDRYNSYRKPHISNNQNRGFSHNNNGVDWDKINEENNNYRKDNYRNENYRNNNNSSIKNEPQENKLQENNEEKPENKIEFENMITNEKLLRGIFAYGFEKPSKIQMLAIPPIIEGRDVIGQSQAGTGKTGAFTIGMLSIIEPAINRVQGIIIANTHELASQIYDVIKELSRFMGIKIALSIGGIPLNNNIEQIRTSHITIGTPGRLQNLVEIGEIQSDFLKLIIIDEADELLKEEFIEQTKNIVGNANEDTQICIFSATMPDEILNITNNFMRNPVHFLIEKEKLSLSLITQYYLFLQDENEKLKKLEELYSRLSINQSIIYVNSIKRANWLKKKLDDLKHQTEVLHSKLPGNERNTIMTNFRKGNFRVLISTDLICRGIDIQQVSYVINYEFPYDVDSYIHRIGRSGRYGKRGIAINFITNNCFRMFKNVEKHYNIKIEVMPDPRVINAYIE
jgi:translation initiation factor 4A